MRKSILRQSAVLAIALLAYSALAFLLPFERSDVFLLSYVFALIAFAAAGVCVWRGFHRGGSLQSRFYGFPIVWLGFLYLAVQAVLSLVFMAVGDRVDPLVPLLIYLLLLAAAAVGMIAVDTAKEEVMRQDSRTKENTARMRQLQTEVSALGGQISSPEAAEAVRRLAEDLRYSDPVSSEALSQTEERLSRQIQMIRTAVLNRDWDQVITLCDFAENTLRERNAACRRMK